MFFYENNAVAIIQRELLTRLSLERANGAHPLPLYSLASGFKKAVT